MTKFLFSTGTARGGTGLVSHMLSTNPKVKIASDPVLGLYKLFRNVTICEGINPELGNFDLNSPLGDSYFSHQQRKILELMLASNLSVKFPIHELNKLHDNLVSRARLASADLIPHIKKWVQGNTFEEVFSNVMTMVQRSRSPAQKLDWVGVHENWTIDFFVPLAKAFPEAKFLIVIRDPRAVFTSNSREKDKNVVGHLVSYARCHRKLIACSYYYQKLEIFRNRLAIVKYEDLISNPEFNCRKICQFLGVEYLPVMLDTTKYMNYATGGIHDGLSNYEKNAQGFNPIRINRWREHLSPDRTDLIDFLCEPEMLLMDYKPVRNVCRKFNYSSCFPTMIKEMEGYKAWRTDFQDPFQDWGYELVRRECLNLQQSPSWLTKDIIERGFLFEEVFHKIRELYPYH